MFDQCLYFGAVEVVPGEEGIAGSSAPVQFGLHDCVADEDALEVETASIYDAVFVLEDLLCEERSIHSTVGLSGQPELVACELWVQFEPFLEG